jgi:RNA polymerase sigma factor (sigma-70 family)
MSAFERLKANTRDTVAFEEWYRETYPELFLYCYRITAGNRALSEDLCQDSIIEFVTRGHLTKITQPEQALAYLRKMAVNSHIDLLRRRSTAANITEIEPVATNAGETSATAEDVYTQLLQRLPSEDHELLGMMFAGETLSRIAAEFNISYSNAGVRVHRIRRLINELSS